jgi:SPP1 gp7 family putative phage head morphogenesis protein
LPELPGEVYELADRFRGELLRGERAAATRMVGEYGKIWARLNNQIQDLARRYYETRAAGQAINADTWLAQFSRLQTLRAQVEGEINRFAQYAGSEIRMQQWEAVQAASVHTEQMIALQLPPGVQVGFNRLPREALQNLVGFLQDGSPLLDLLNELGIEAGKAISDALIQGLALGLGPRQIALQSRKALGGNLARALRIARTETLRAYREATYQTYQANRDLIGGWVWKSARNQRTCAACWAMDGTEHSIDERLDDHVNGRCFSVPKTKTWKELGFDIEETRYRTKDTGIEAFEKLSEPEQLRVLGPAKFAAYKAGEFKLPDLVGRQFDRHWGNMRYEKSLVQIGLDKSEWLKVYRTNPVKPLIRVEEAARQIVALHTEIGGSTFSLTHGNMAGKPFHSVSIFPDLTVRFEGRQVTQRQIRNFIEKYGGLARDKVVAIGTWYSESEDATYLDLSVLVGDQELAVKLAKEYNQIGIYDLGQVRYIETGGTGQAPDDMSPLQVRLENLEKLL